MHSALYTGWVQHRRWSPVKHGFRYQLSMLYLDLDEIDETLGRGWLWSTRALAPFRFARRDHLGSPTVPLAECVRDVIRDSGRAVPDGPIRLLTQPRYFGFVINPVSFFFCFDRGEQLQTIVAEVVNTPWKERYCYVIDANHDRHERFEKQFHVSPFLPMDMQYQWSVSPPNEELRVRIENFREGDRVFSAAMKLEREPLSAASLAMAAIRFPLMTQRVFTAIYWQAFLLWRKGCRYYPHPKNLPRLATSPPPPACSKV